MTDPMRVLDETALSPSGAAAVLRTTARTVVRWLSSGVKLADGRVVRLEGVRVGTLWKTSREACRRFVAATTAHPPDTETPKVGRRASAATTKILEKWGVK